MPAGVLSAADPAARFNPHPAFRPGDADHPDPPALAGLVVSIRTRPFGRVMPKGFRDQGIVIKFQSAPGLSAG